MTESPSGRVLRTLHASAIVFVAGERGPTLVELERMPPGFLPGRLVFTLERNEPAKAAAVTVAPWPFEGTQHGAVPDPLTVELDAPLPPGGVLTINVRLEER